MSKKAVAVLADGFEETEAIAVIDILKRANIDVTIVSINSKLEVTGAHGIVVCADEVFESNKMSDFDLIFLPGGGLGTKNLCASNQLRDCLIDANQKGKYIVAICAAPTFLGLAGILNDKDFTCYPGFEKEIPGNFKTEKVVQDGKIFTSRGVGTAIDLGLAIVQEIFDKQTSDKLAESIIYR